MPDARPVLVKEGDRQHQRDDSQDEVGHQRNNDGHGDENHGQDDQRIDKSLE